MPERRFESVDVTELLRNTLDEYPSGSATIRELLQNTDDSGATTQTFYLDTRTFPSTALVDPALSSCQGPAIIAENDGLFEEKDWISITEIRRSSKKQDETKSGRYGLGFRSCYHVTDNPQILSGGLLLILDPHARINMFSGGVQLSTTGADRKAYKDHFNAFDAVLSTDDKRYDGTAIRLPLRLDASESSIKSTATSVKATRQIFLDFMNNELAECMLFLKHITNVDFIEINKDGSHTTLGRSWLNDPEIVGPLRSRNRGRESETSHHMLTVNVDVGGEFRDSQWIITHFVEDYKFAQNLLDRRILGRSSLANDMANDKLVPHVALAFPVKRQNQVTSQFSGRLFTLLPLPIFTGFPLHINAVLALTQSRQHLRSADAVTGSREEFLVIWNRIVFVELVPKAWAAMFKHFTTLPQKVDFFAAWPPFSDSGEGDRIYWELLPARVFKEAAPMAVWPMPPIAADSPPAYQKLSDLLVASQSTKIPVSFMKICGVPIITVPASVLALVKQSVQYRSRLLIPATVHPFLKRNPSAFTALDAAAVNAIAEYLATGDDVLLLYDLPLFLDFQGNYKSLRPKMTHTFATNIEADLFRSADPDLLRFDNLSSAVRSLLKYSPAENIHRIRTIDMVEYLSTLFGHFKSKTATVSAGIKVEDSAWLVQFWNWINDRGPKASLFSDQDLLRLQQMYLIPLDAPEAQPKLRKLAGGVMDGGALEEDLRGVLRFIGVPMLHPDVAVEGQTQINLQKQGKEIFFLLENITTGVSLDQLDQNSRRILYSFFADRLPPFLRGGWTLSFPQKMTLRSLPIFPTLSPGPRPAPSQSAVLNFGAAPTSSSFVDESVEVVPVISGKSFLDGREGAILAQALGQTTEGEMDILGLVLDSSNWTQQASDARLSDLLIDRIVSRLADFDVGGLNRISRMSIVTVGHNLPLATPSSVIDPRSKIAPLYDTEDGVLPRGRFAQDGPGTLLQQLRSFGMLCSTLDDIAIVKHIRKLSDNSTPFARRETKALLLLTLLDKYSLSTMTSTLLQTSIRDQAWLPANGKMYRPAECWDSQQVNAELCDFVVPLVSTTKALKSLSLRAALGWTSVPLSVLQAQLVAVVRNQPMHPRHSQDPKSKRIGPILYALSQRLQSERISNDDIAEVIKALGDLPWVPISLDGCCRPHHAVLGQGDHGTRFHRVYLPLTEKPAVVELLKVMGIRHRPSSSALINELRLIAADLIQAGKDGRSKGDLMGDAVAILQEISRRPSDFDLTQVLVPDDKENMQPVASVIFNDRGADGGEPSTGLFFAHPSIPQSVALALGVRQFSEEELNRDEAEIEAFHITGDLAARVTNRLKGHDLDYASNEWIANADTAKASTIKFVVHEEKFTGTKLLAPDMKQFQQNPSLLIYNDGVFTESDFRGIGRVGLGDTGTTGRFGLGAFSFYHFTEVLMVVSGDSVLFLDPSQAYLPQKKGESRRTGIKMPISLCRSRYPDHLKPLDGKFGFESTTENYPGTLFRLPLRTVSQAKESKLSKTSFTASAMLMILHRYFRPATQSIFFSGIKSISASFLARNTWSTIWSVEGSRHSIEGEGCDQCVDLEIRDSDKASWKESWLVCMSRHEITSFPENLRTLFQQHRLPLPTTGIALNTFSEGNQSRGLNSRLFATLPLPVTTTLPAHVHATWILSNDRRPLRYDVIDGSEQRPLDTRFNDYIMQTLIPPVYLRALAVIALRNPPEMERCWPTQSTDLLSQEVTSSLYAQLKDTEERVLRTHLDDVIAPKDALIHVRGPVAVMKILAGLNMSEFVHRVPFDPVLVVEWDAFRTDSANEVAAVLRQRTTDVGRFYQSDHSNAADLNTILRYLVYAGVDLVEVPLLQLANGQVTTFKPASEPHVFCTSRSEMGNIFGWHTVIGPDISQAMMDAVCGLKLNVGALSVEGLRETLSHSAAHVVSSDEAAIAASRLWYEELLKFLTSPTSSVGLEGMADLPLIPVSHQEVTISLNRACQLDIWWESNGDHAITPVLWKCGIRTVRFPNSWSFRRHGVDLASVLDVLGSSGTHRQLDQHEVVASPEWEVFTQWMEPHLNPSELQRLTDTQAETLKHIPLFLGRQGQTPVRFTSASNTSMLPPQVTVSDFSIFFPTDAAFASFSYPLQATLKRLGLDQSLTVHAVLGQINLPNILPPSEETALKSLVNMIWKHHRGIYALPLVPDENWNLRVPSALYDKAVLVFQQSFHNRPEVFVHPNFRDVMSKLVPLGVHQTVTAEDIVRCAGAVDQDSRTEGMDTGIRAEFLWHFINDGFKDAHHLDFKDISGLRFVPSLRQRHPTEPQFSQYDGTIPEVLSLSRLCLAEHAQIAWTQRATFAEAPSASARRISKELGVPNIHDLVEHLVALATVVAVEHTGSEVLLSDLSQTYSAIHKQAAVAKPLLLRYKDSRIWLNIETQEKDEQWVWRSASELVFDLRYDLPNFYDVKAFLKPFRQILVGGGAREYSYAPLALSATSPHADKLLAGWQNLREEGKFLDVQFNVDNRVIEAHRGLLAAVVPYFKPEGSQASADLYSVPPGSSAFAVQSYIDYVYTGNFEMPSPVTTEESRTALEALLGLLQLACTAWPLEDLKILVIEVMVKLHLVRAETCDSILERIQGWDVPQLVGICQQNRANNDWV